MHCQTKEKVREQEIIRMADELGIDKAIHSWGFYASTMENAVSNGPNILSGGDAPCQ